jgi:hypothetical protein
MLKWVPKKLNLKLMDWVYFAYNVNQWLCVQNTVINMHVTTKGHEYAEKPKRAEFFNKDCVPARRTCGRDWHIVACQRRVCQLRNVTKSFSSHTACRFLCPIPECDMCGYIYGPAR